MQRAYVPGTAIFPPGIDVHVMLLSKTWAARIDNHAKGIVGCGSYL
jgi:hypothetical protein